MNTAWYENEFHEIIKKARVDFEIIQSEWSDDVQKKFYEEYVQNLMHILQEHLKNQMQV